MYTKQFMQKIKNLKLILGILVTITLVLLVLLAWQPSASLAQNTVLENDGTIFLPFISGGYGGVPPMPALGDYVVIGWNDLGMHCYNRNFQDLAVLPPWNTLWAQVIQRGDPPLIVTENITVTYSFPDNTYSVEKSNFWDYAQPLFNLTSPLPPNIGLTGKGLAGTMDMSADHFIAEGIPLTEYDDDYTDATDRQPYQLADIVVTGSGGVELARNRVVAPVSTEMHCEYCHADGEFDISTGRVETNILTLHDEENQDEYPGGNKPLMSRRPILCAECHASNALGAPGEPGIPNFSQAMHEKHAGKVQDSTDGCYACHPGPDTKCLRDVMSSEYEMGCTDCHGGMEDVAQENRNPWLDEPRCDVCHDELGYEQDQDLYRFSKGHGGVYCEACHDSTHAIATSNEARDAIKFVNLQGHSGTLAECTVCHLTEPTAGGPHR